MPTPLIQEHIEKFRDTVDLLKNSKIAKNDVDEYGSCETEVTEFGYWYFDGEKRDWWIVVDFGYIEKFFLIVFEVVEVEAMKVERERIIRLSDKIEAQEPDGGMREWMAFKALRNTLRGKLNSL